MSSPETPPILKRAEAAGTPALNSPLAEILVGLALFFSACAAITFTRVPGGIALVWPANAIAAALLIRLRQVRWSIAVVLVLLAAVLASVIAAQRPWSSAALFAGVHGIEIALMVLAFRFIWRFPYPKITISHAAFMNGALRDQSIPGLAALLAGLVLRNQLPGPFGAETLRWWSSHAIGACLLGPPIILFSVKELKRLTRGRFLLENLLTCLACLAGCYLAIRYVRFPFVGIGLLLLIAAFRLGGFGTSVVSLGLGLLITNLWLIGVRPLGLDPVAAASGSLEGPARDCISCRPDAGYRRWLGQ